ncbi:MAG: hypothetical protein CML24_00875 [Rhizobiales bacterium]|nr:hypothetical protein [Hyphomicrobiales bacterium]
MAQIRDTGLFSPPACNQGLEAIDNQLISTNFESKALRHCVDTYFYSADRGLSRGFRTVG